MAAKHEALRKEYQASLEDYLTGAGEVALKHAHELGRRALTDGMGVLEWVALQYEALAAVLMKIRSVDESARTAESVKDFAVESLSAFEMTHRAFVEANITLRRLNEKLNEQLEEGARQVAHVLHDEAGQLLTAVHLAIGQVARKLPPRARDQFQEVRELLRQIEQQLRRLSHELRPLILDDFGVVPALKFLAQGISERAGLPIIVEGTTDGRLPPSIETTLYRIVQEALNNLTKHAKATSAKVEVKRENGTVRCSVQDDGIGFDVATVLAMRGERGLGLVAMQERLGRLGGSVEIDSAPQRGTKVLITIPL